MRSVLLPFALLAVLLGLAACQMTTATAPAPSSEAVSATAAIPPAPSPQPAKPVASQTARTLAQNCFTCHGPNGKSPGAIPSLTRLGAERIASRLRDFKSGTEPSTVMGRHAKAYSDAELQAVANYIASLNE